MRSKRLKITIICLVVNFMMVMMGIAHQADLTALGTCIALINTPLYAYIFGETVRKSES
jgi:hypothetical protein